MKRLLTSFLLVFSVGVVPRANGHTRIPPPTRAEQKILAEMDNGTPAAVLLRRLRSNQYHLALKAALLIAQRKDTLAVAALKEDLLAPITLQNKWSSYAALVALCKLGDRKAADIITRRAPKIVRSFMEGLLPGKRDLEILDGVKKSYGHMLISGLPPEKAAHELISRVDVMSDWVEDSIVELGKAAVPPLLEKAGDPAQTPFIRIEMIHCLGRIGDRSAVPLLQKILEDSTKEGGASLDELFGEAGYALVRLAGIEGLRQVQAAFRGNKRWVPRLYLLRALGALNLDAARIWLEQIATQPALAADTQASRRPADRAEAVRAHAALSAAKIRTNLAEDRVTTLLSLLKHPHPWVRSYAAQRLLGSTEPRVFAGALAALKDSEPTVRRYVIEILGLSGNRSAASYLKKIISTGDISDQVPAKLALENLGYAVVWSEGTFHVVDADRRSLQLFLSSNPAEKEKGLAALWALGKEGGLVLAASIQGKDPSLSSAAQAALEMLGERLADDHAGLEARQSCLKVLKGASQFGIPVLVSGICRSTRPQRRREMAAALAKAGTQAVPAIAAVLNSGQNATKPYVEDLMFALGQCGPSGAFFLQQYTHSTDASLRARAFQAIGWLESEEWVDPVLAGLKDSEAPVREQCIAILRKWKNPVLVSRLHQMQETGITARTKEAIARILEEN